MTKPTETERQSFVTFCHYLTTIMITKKSFPSFDIKLKRELFGLTVLPV